MDGWLISLGVERGGEGQVKQGMDGRDLRRSGSTPDSHQHIREDRQCVNEVCGCVEMGGPVGVGVIV